jgi:hypothetical protein
MCWGKTLPASEHEANWDWLVRSIDGRRVNETLRYFPCDDCYFPIVSLRSKLDEQQISAHDCCFCAERKEKMKARATEGDNRYSPGFLLPLVLAAMEEAVLFVSSDNIDNAIQFWRCHSVDSISPSQLAATQKAIQLTRSLCDKGVAALLLACLCSHCENLRKVAVSALGLITIVVCSGAARCETSWRERSQLQMLLCSVQRSIAIRRVEEPSTMVPQILGLAAIFLARASKILSNPRSSVFGTINRVFLRSEDNHGAFTELNRLPVFISLFCSQHEDSGQAHVERTWAMETLMHGFLDSTCFGAVAGCHAPELLQTYLDTIARTIVHGVSENDCILPLQVLRSMIESGQDRATVQLVGRCGFISWLTSFSISALHSGESFKSVLVRQTFLEIVQVTIDQAVRFLTLDETLILSIQDLACPVLELSVHHLDQLNKTDRSQQAKLINCTRHILEAIASIVDNSCNENLIAKVSLASISVSKCTELLVYVSDVLVDHDMLTAVVASICRLVLDFDTNEPPVLHKYGVILLRALASLALTKQANPYPERQLIGTVFNVVHIRRVIQCFSAALDQVVSRYHIESKNGNSSELTLKRHRLVVREWYQPHFLRVQVTCVRHDREARECWIRCRTVMVDFIQE